jgi:hypothetical protein
MQTNPILEARAARENYPYRVVCVFLDAENNDFPIINEVMCYCCTNNLTFVAREYNPDKHPEDSSIERLPAFHIYQKSYVVETHYYDLDPVYKIQLMMWEFEDSERERLARKERWNSRIKSLFSFERFLPRT